MREAEGIYGPSVPLGLDIVLHPCQNQKAYSKGSFGGFTGSLPVLVEIPLAALPVRTLAMAAGRVKCHDDSVEAKLSPSNGRFPRYFRPPKEAHYVKRQSSIQPPRY